MRLHGTAIWRHRHELALGAALVLTVSLLALVGPLLLALAVLEWWATGRRRRLIGLALTRGLAHAALWLWRDLRGAPHGRWHPCARCGVPVEAPSRAQYCSPSCRSWARLERHAAGGDERAAARLARLHRGAAEYDPALAEVPF